MVPCWKMEQKDRPKFIELLTTLDKLAQDLPELVEKQGKAAEVYLSASVSTYHPILSPTSSALLPRERGSSARLMPVVEIVSLLNTDWIIIAIVASVRKLWCPGAAGRVERLRRPFFVV